MHESSTAGSEDEPPREDGLKKAAEEPADARPEAGDDTGGPAAEPVGGTAAGSGTVATGGPGAPGGPAAPGAGGASGAAGTEAGAAPPARRVPERSQAEQDEIFAALVAQFDEPAGLNSPDWPESENLRGRGESRSGTASATADLADLAPQPRPRPAQPVVPAAGPRDYEAAEDPDEGHFVPPEPPPLPEADVTAKFAWLAVLGGPALLLFDAVFWQEVAGWPAWVGVTAFLGGFVTLVVRMKDRDEDEPEDPTGGAVV
ncbi:hypothetical protein GCM10018781_52590 [Kitasatospora indigofera]|uniref:Uncharacterized protein n=1 Tax=Kitasatospora indigofera TaxID=67307 RepID=A0A919G4J3_9ACTN|nr:hypothetical protein [Kitasatospora indigofera]GHH77993.1 hypothetical protein GCM10018781_52590 [Kitasatospora indigofera]